MPSFVLIGPAAGGALHALRGCFGRCPSRHQAPLTNQALRPCLDLADSALVACCCFSQVPEAIPHDEYSSIRSLLDRSAALPLPPSCVVTLRLLNELPSTYTFVLLGLYLLACSTRPFIFSRYKAPAAPHLSWHYLLIKCPHGS